jgi:hypothetical protein
MFLPKCHTPSLYTCRTTGNFEVMPILFILYGNNDLFLTNWWKNIDL